MLPHRSSLLLPSGSAPRSPDRASCAKSRAHPHRIWRSEAVTLVETMCALWVLATIMLGFIAAFIQSRRVTESSVLHAAATSMVYGIIEQVKQLDYTSVLPNYELDPQEPTGTKARPYIRVRLNQGTPIWLTVKHTLASTAAAPTTPLAPTTTPATLATIPNSIVNTMGSIPLSTVTGSLSQQINLKLCIWVDEISNVGVWSAEGTAPAPDTSDVKKVTVVYTYEYQDGGNTKTVRDMEVFLRTRYDQ